MPLARGRLLLTLILLLAVAARGTLLLGPFGQLEADEAVVGLMARHILAGDRPLFYWGQGYLGTLEPFTAAALFALVGPSTLALKAVPTAYSIAYVLLSYLVARRLFGRGPALLVAGYLALPPFFLLLWSTKPRGGYVEFMALGEATLLAALWAASSRRPLLLGGAGLLALGVLAVWTHPLGAVYALPAGLYVGLRRRGDLPRWTVAVGLLAALAAVAVLLRAFFAARLPDTPGALQGLQLAQGPLNLARLLRVGGAVLIGLAQGTSNEPLFDADWPNRLGSFYLVTALLAVGVTWLVIRYAPSLLAATRPAAPESAAGPALLLMVLILAPLVIAFTAFGQKLLIIEPRYALPLYSVVPLAANELWRLRRLRARSIPVQHVRPDAERGIPAATATSPARPAEPVVLAPIAESNPALSSGVVAQGGSQRDPAVVPRGVHRAPPAAAITPPSAAVGGAGNTAHLGPLALALACAAVLAINVASWLSADLTLNLPATIGATTPATRVALRDWLEGHDLRFVYTNYWLAYPLAFESDERITPSVIADGFNRYIPYAHWVFVSPRPAWVFVADGAEERAFLDRVRQAGGHTQAASVSIYRVYYDVEPLDRLRP